jgi:hypothetical protein
MTGGIQDVKDNVPRHVALGHHSFGWLELTA